MVWVSAALSSPPARIRFLMARQSRVGSSALSSAASPVTWGAAIEVPLNVLYVFAGVVLRISLPGAPTWTVCLPKFEKEARASVRVVAATAITLGR